MGYDMYAVNSAGLPRDVIYFRANIYGMTMLRTAMYIAEVLETDTPSPSFPSRDELESITDEEEERTARWEELKFSTVSKRSDFTGKVPVFKFGSNDGWIVCAEECQLIADALYNLLNKSTEELTYKDSYDGATVNIEKAFVKEFADYCQRMAKHEGFAVY